jgi:hypothetical protein
MKALRIAHGPVLWALHFALVYGFTALACARGFSHTVPSAVAAATLVLGALTALVILRNARRRNEFIDWLAAALGGFALLAIVWEAIPAFMVPACA